MKKIYKYWPYVTFAIASLAYYWRVFLKGDVPFPGDLMVGAYLPWLESKWGYPTGVPIKNPLISDIFSQFFMWKSLIAESWKNFQIPLWNPYSYSGYPLLASFHSGVFYPLGFLYLLVGDIWGWDILVIFPSFAAALTMYLYLRRIKIKPVGAVLGGVIYSYSGFAISWAQFVTAAQAMIWMPLVFIVLERYFETKSRHHLYYLPFIFFLLITSGHFQIMVYISLLSIAYFIWKWFEVKDLKMIRDAMMPGVLTIGLSAFQLLPTLELSRFGLRSVENYISGYNYGLLPIKYLATLIAPDYFGNPATGNFFGVFNYHEAIFYSGVLSIFGLLLSITLFRINRYIRFYLVVALIAFMIGFDTPLGRAIYTYNLPGISTSAAGRIAVIFSMSLAIISGIVVSNLDKIKVKHIVVAIGGVVSSFFAIYFLARFGDSIFSSTSNAAMSLVVKRAVTLRNLILPGMLVVIYSMALLASKKWRVVSGLLIVVTCLEMFRFGWKYIPFVPARIVYPETSITDFIKNRAKTETFRVDRERAEIMPPATWMQYRIMSPSGYDPMAIKDYASVYQEEINGNFSGLVGRYSELERYDADALGRFNVKYLLVTKRDSVGKLGGNNINYSIDQKKWIRVFESESTAILENKSYQQRARILESNKGVANILAYTPNQIRVNFENGKGKTLLLSDTWYPGWVAKIDGKKVDISRCEKIFRCVNLDRDSGEVVFTYEPDSFWIGLRISVLSLILSFICLHLTKRR